jgi:hypothetical protein
MTSMGQMMPKQPLIIIIWTHQEMMAWMSRKSICILDVLMQDFHSKLGKLYRQILLKSIGILDVFMGDFGSKLGKLGIFCFTANRQSNTA